jgi:hypothetical protein
MRANKNPWHAWHAWRNSGKFLLTTRCRSPQNHRREGIASSSREVEVFQALKQASGEGGFIALREQPATGKNRGKVGTLRSRQRQIGKRETKRLNDVRENHPDNQPAGEGVNRPDVAPLEAFTAKGVIVILKRHDGT